MLEIHETITDDPVKNPETQISQLCVERGLMAPKDEVVPKLLKLSSQ
jgi:hypothetical protein